MMVRLETMDTREARSDGDGEAGERGREDQEIQG